MREKLQKLIKIPTHGEYLEIRLEKRVFTLIRLQNGFVEKIRQGVEKGGYVRVLNPHTGWWFTTFSGWDELQRRVEEALHSSAFLPRGNGGVVRGEPIEDMVTASVKDDFRFKSLKSKIDLLVWYARILKEASSLIVNSTVEYRDEWREIHIANSDGSIISVEKPDIALKFGVVARKGDAIETYQNGLAEKSGFEVVQGQENLAQEVANSVLALLEAPSFEGGTLDVVLDPVLAGVFIHEAFGHLSEADFLSRNEHLQKIMVLGKEVASPVLSVFDDGSIAGLRGSYAYDDEGMPTQRTYLIKNGCLAGRLHSRETAYLLKESPTGNARTVSYQFPPLVRMSNTGIEPGEMDRETLFSDIKRGLYAVEYIGGNTALELFTFSAAYGYRIENGKVGEMVKDVVLSGNLFRTLRKIDALASDFRWTQIGGCGKGSQVGLHKPTRSPHYR
ncbi:MAG: TldD/PmbA family protein, partial [Candidatus Caldatribacteriaceae bacterium]